MATWIEPLADRGGVVVSTYVAILFQVVNALPVPLSRAIGSGGDMMDWQQRARGGDPKILAGKPPRPTKRHLSPAPISTISA